MRNEPVWHGDCLALMRELPAASVDAFFVDPPYGTTRCSWDAIIPFEPMWSEIKRTRRKGATILFTATQPFASALVMSNPTEFRHEWIWEKNKATGHLNAKRAPMRAHENVLVFCDVAPPYQPQMTGGHRPMNAYTQTSNGDCYGATKRPSGGGSTLRYPRSVQRIDIVNNDDPAKIHPTQKPEQLWRYFLETYTKPGDLVLDFACGSGSAGVAAVKAGRRFIGIEKDQDFAAAALMAVTEAGRRALDGESNHD